MLGIILGVSSLVAMSAMVKGIEIGAKEALIANVMYEHVVEHGRMFNQIDDEMARSVCVIGTEVRDEIFASPQQVGHEIIPLGQTITINGQALTIIGMFQHYENEQERKQREF